MKILTFSDVHLADNNPTARIDNYQEALFNKLEQIRVAAEKLKCAFIISAGDLFHIKEPRNVSHALVQRAIKFFKSFPCPVLALPGNHDLHHNRIESLPKQPLGTVFESGAILNILTSGGWGFKPDSGPPVVVRGLPYADRPDLESFQDLFHGCPKDAVKVLVAHCFASEKGGVFFDNRVFSYRELLDACSPSVAVLGHWHVDNGICKVEDSWFINVGALSRGSLDGDNLKRDVKIGLISIDGPTVDVKALKLKVRPVEEIFDLKAKEKAEQDNAKINAFVSELKSEIDTTADLTTIVDNMNLPAKVRAKFDYYYEQAGA